MCCFRAGEKTFASAEAATKKVQPRNIIRPMLSHEEVVARKKKVLEQIRDLMSNRTFELLFPLQYLDIKISYIRRTPLETLIEEVLLPGLRDRGAGEKGP